MVPKQIAAKIEGPLSKFFQGIGIELVRIEHLSPARVNPIPTPSTSNPPVIMPEPSGKGKNTWKIPLIIATIILFVVAVGFICLYVHKSSTDNKTISSLNNNIASDNSSISSQQNTITNNQTQINNLQKQISNLQNELNLLVSSTEANAVTINQTAGESTSIVSFSANYAGFIFVSGTTTTSNGYIKVTDTANGYPNYPGYTFKTGDTWVIPILPGTITVSFANSNSVNGVTATITVIYYY